MKKVSDKRRQQLKRYMEYKYKLFHVPKNRRLKCFLSNNLLHYDNIERCFIGDIHHLDGREEDKLNDYKDVVPVIRKYHTMIHSMSVEQLLKTSWYYGFLNRLKNKDTDLWKKEILKQYKAGIITLDEYINRVIGK